MQFHDASLITSAANESGWPKSTLPEVIFAGRSNAGKSTLINALVNRKNLAYSGKTAGKTRLLNFFKVDDKVVFTDAPGYGYATSDAKSAIAFGKLMEPYFAKRKNLKAMILVLDARREPNEDDITMIEYGRQSHLKIVVACTKTDKISRGKFLSNAQKIANILQLPTNALLPVDSLKKTGLDALWQEIDKVIK